MCQCVWSLVARTEMSSMMLTILNYFKACYGIPDILNHVDC
jgi:hypothetical protein